MRQPVAKQAVDTVNVVCISDTHNSQPRIPYGDLPIHAGNLTQSGSLREIQRALDCLKCLPHRFIAGNHDILLQSNEKNKLDWQGLTYLADNATGIQFPGSES